MACGYLNSEITQRQVAKGILACLRHRDCPVRARATKCEYNVLRTVSLPAGNERFPGIYPVRHMQFTDDWPGLAKPPGLGKTGKVAQRVC